MKMIAVIIREEKLESVKMLLETIDTTGLLSLKSDLRPGLSKRTSLKNCLNNNLI